MVATYGAPAGDDSPQWRGITGRGDGESSPAGGRNLTERLRGTASLQWRTSTGWGGRAVHASRWSQLEDRVRGTASLQRRTSTGWGDGQSMPAGGRSLRSACRGGGGGGASGFYGHVGV